MDIQMVTGYNPQADAQKTAPIKGTDDEKGQAGSEALSFNKYKPAQTHTSSIIDKLLSSITHEEQAQTDKRMEMIAELRLPEVSGFKMARLV